jgi:riboflavin transporter FmnP
MSDILFQYVKVNPTSWAYLSSLLTLALFFKFNRVFSIRNLDLVLLILLAPGLMLVQWGVENVWNDRLAPAPLEMQRLGFIWMFAVQGLLMTRLLLDSALVRRPLLDPNLNAAGLAFLGSSLLFFLMSNVVTGPTRLADMSPAVRASEVQTGEERADTFDTEGPGYWLLYVLPRITTQTVVAGTQETPPETPRERERQDLRVRVITARVMAILSHVLIVTGLVLVGVRHFDNLNAGLAMASLYLLLPYTALWTGSVEHGLPGSLLTWAIVLYRRPLIAGMLIGLAGGTIYYPIFLLPLWCSYYWERGVKRFLTGVVIAIAALLLTLALTAGSVQDFLKHLSQMFGIRPPLTTNLQGIWRDAAGFWSYYYRFPILALFVFLAISYVAWPVRKHLGTLMSCTAALMIGAQFWHAHGGGIYVAWYLPLYLMTIFRPNLEERLATTMVPESWWTQRQRARAAAAFSPPPSAE